MIQKFTGFLRSCFLFQCTPAADWPRKRRVGFWVWNGGWTLASGVGITLVSLLLALGHYSLGLARGYLECPLIVLLNVLPVLALLLLLYGATGRSHWAFLITAAIVLGFSVGNYYKLMFRDDPLMFADLLLLKEAGNMAGKYHLFLDWKLVLTFLCVVGGFCFLRFLARGRPDWRGRVSCAVIGVLALVLLMPTLMSNRIYKGKAAYYTRLQNQWSSTQQYLAHGFVYPFIHSISDAIETPPEGYREAEAAALLAQYEDADIPEGQKVNVVGIMLEAFQDFSRFNVLELPDDIYADYHTLESESFRGDLVTNIFGGDTVNTERTFLTGYADLDHFRSRTNAYPWYFRSQGYQVTGMHPCFQWFYNRLNINENLGFQNYQFVENRFGQFTGGNVADDSIFFRELISDLTEMRSGAPIFSFSVTYQGHGPYTNNRCWWGEPEQLLGPSVMSSFPEDQRYILANYFGSVQDTSRRLLELRDFLAAQDEPYVLVVFGDHNPWMGDGNVIYNAMGLNLDQSTQDGFRNYYATRYLIWANDAAKAATGNDFLGDGPTLGPYFLMNQLFDLCGWTGPAYMQATRAVADRVPVQHSSGIYLENGIFTPDLTAEGTTLSQEYQWLQYYAKHHFSYRDVD